MEAKPGPVKLSYEVAEPLVSKNSEKKPPIILLHGMTATKESWSSLAGPIAAETGRKVYFYDARNHGDSGWSDEFNYETLWYDLLRFMEEVHVQKAILVGHSMGGLTVMNFALKWPEKVEKLILEDAPLRAPSDDLLSNYRKIFQQMHSAVEKIPADVKDLSEAKSFLMKYLATLVPQMSRGQPPSKEDIDGSKLPLTQSEADGKFMWKTNFKAIDRLFEKRVNTPDAGRVYEGPTLHLWGTKSPLDVMGGKDLILQFFPKTKFQAVEGADHAIHLGFRDVFLQEVIKFINEEE